MFRTPYKKEDGVYRMSDENEQALDEAWEDGYQEGFADGMKEANDIIGGAEE